MLKRKKIICTVGPSTLSADILRKLDKLDVDMLRINLSHTPLEEVVPTIKFIQKLTLKPICIDTEGAQIRNFYMQNQTVYFEKDEIIQIHKREIIGDTKNIYFKPDGIVQQLEVGDLVKVDFHNMILRITEKNKQGAKAIVLSPGQVGSNKAVSLNRPINLPPLTTKDKEVISKICLENHIKYIALSFASKKEDIELIRKMTHSAIEVIAKVESSEGIRNLEEILQASDAILIDRGDLSKEESIEKIPFLQKIVIRKAKEKNCPVFVATNLLESMISNQTPTRSEISDVVNILFEGGDGLVLAAETAIGQHPVECVEMIKKLIYSFEFLKNESSLPNIQNYY